MSQRFVTDGTFNVLRDVGGATAERGRGHRGTWAGPPRNVGGATAWAPGCPDLLTAVGSFGDVLAISSFSTSTWESALPPVLLHSSAPQHLLCAECPAGST